MKLLGIFNSKKKYDEWLDKFEEDLIIQLKLQGARIPTALQVEDAINALRAVNA